MRQHMMLDVADAIQAGIARRPRYVPLTLRQLLAQAGALGVSGSRAPDAESLAALADVAARIGSFTPVLVGDARGIDAAAAAHWLHAEVVLRAGDTPRELVARSIRLVEALATQPGPLLVALPGRACPAGVAPAPRWVSGGSGTWSTAALAIGRGVRAVVWLPGSFLPPAGWQLSYLGGGWWASVKEDGDGA